MLYPARKLIEQEFAVALVNAQIALLNTRYTLSVPDVAVLYDGTERAPDKAASYPALFHLIGADTEGAQELKAFGRRDADIPIALLYVTHQSSLATSRQHCDVTLEALNAIVEGLAGKQWGTTSRSCYDVANPSAQLGLEMADGAVIRHGAALRFTMRMRAEGV